MMVFNTNIIILNVSVERIVLHCLNMWHFSKHSAGWSLGVLWRYCMKTLSFLLPSTFYCCALHSPCCYFCFCTWNMDTDSIVPHQMLVGWLVPPLPTLATIRLSTVCISCEWWWSFLCSWTQLLAFTDWILLWWKTVIPVPKHQAGTTFSIYVAVVVIWWPCSLDCIPCCVDKGCKTLLTGRSLLICGCCVWQKWEE